MSQSKKQLSVDEEIIEPIRRESPHIFVTTEEETPGGDIELVARQLMNYESITEVDSGYKTNQECKKNTDDEHANELFPDVDREEMIQPVKVRSRPITPTDEIRDYRDEDIHHIQPINIVTRPLTPTKQLDSSENSLSSLAQELLQTSQGIMDELQNKTLVKRNDSVQDVEEDVLQPLDVKIETERQKIEVKNRDVDQNVVVVTQKKETKRFFIPDKSGNVVDFRRARALENWQKAFQRVQPPFKRMVKLVMNLIALQRVSEGTQNKEELPSPSSHVNADENVIVALRVSR